MNKYYYSTDFDLLSELLVIWNRIVCLCNQFHRHHIIPICGNCLHATDGQCLTVEEAKKYRYSIACEMHFEGRF